MGSHQWRTPAPSSLTAFGSAAAPFVRRSWRSDRYAELDAHRGIAVLALVVFHAYQFCNVNHFLYRGTPAYTVLNSLDAMIPWLFVLTAFLLFEPVARGIIDGRSAISPRGLLTRPAVRLLPLYCVVVVVVWFSRQPSLPGDARDLIEHLTFTQVFDEKRIFYTIGPAWAISVAVFCYLGLAALCVGVTRVCRRLPGRRQRIAVLGGSTVVLGLISMAWKAWAFASAHELTTGSYTTWFGPLANLDNFAVGMAIAVLAAALAGTVTPMRRRRRSALRASGLAVLVLAFVARQANTWSAVYFSTACAIGFGCLIAAAVLGPRRDRQSWALRGGPLLWLGAISYSVFLWHEPILLALRGTDGPIRQAPGAFPLDATVLVAVSLLVGWISYRTIERSTNRLAQMFGSDGHVRTYGAGIGTGTQIDRESFRNRNPV